MQRARTPKKEKTAPRRIQWFAPRTKKPNFALSVLTLSLKMLAVFVVAVGLAGGGLVLGIAKAYVEGRPTLDIQSIEDQDLTSFIYDINGQLITEYSGVENRVYATLAEMPKNLINAFIAVEDARFSTHNGVDMKRLIGSFVKNLTSSTNEGGSTITQQLVRLSMLTTEQTYKRKLQEAYLSIDLEGNYSKDQILEAYLNIIPLGEGNYGVKAAAMDYFGKELTQLSLRECAMLAGITKSPVSYSPRRNYVRNPEHAGVSDTRTATVLNAMYAQNYITTRAEYDRALSEKVAVTATSSHNQMYDMPYAVEYVVSDVVTHLVAARGLPDTKENRTAIENEVRKSGYRIYSTIDPNVQLALEDTIFNWESWPRLANNSKHTKRVQVGSAYVEIDQPQAAATIIDWRTGSIVAMVGGRQQPTQRKLLNRATQSMPVGSSIKPISVYGPALDLGISPAQPLPNFGLPIVGWQSEFGYPSNYSPGKTAPMVSLRKAMASSLNIGAAHALLDFVGVADSTAYLLSMGIDPAHINTNDDGSAPTPFALALGGAGPSTVEMAAAFGAIANKGLYQEPVSFSKVTDAQGNVILDMQSTEHRISRQIFRPATAWLLVDLLKGSIRGTGSSAVLDGMTTVGKTGTNSDYRGVFFSGMTPYYSAALWIGHDDYTPAFADGTTGGKAAAPLWKEFMQRIHEGLDDKPIIEGSGEGFGLVKATVCGLSGLLPGDACSHDLNGIELNTDWFFPEDVPTETCTMHRQVVICRDSNKLVGAYCPAESRLISSVVLIDPLANPMFGLMTQEIANAEFPGAIVGLTEEELAVFGSFNAAYAEHFCMLHTPMWYAERGLAAPMPNYTTPFSTLWTPDETGQIDVLNPDDPFGLNAQQPPDIPIYIYEN